MYRKWGISSFGEVFIICYFQSWGASFSEIKWIQWIQKQLIVTLRYAKREKVAFIIVFRQRLILIYFTV